MDDIVTQTVSNTVSYFPTYGHCLYARHSLRPPSFIGVQVAYFSNLLLALHATYFCNLKGGCISGVQTNFKHVTKSSGLLGQKSFLHERLYPDTQRETYMERRSSASERKMRAAPHTLPVSHTSWGEPWKEKAQVLGSLRGQTPAPSEELHTQTTISFPRKREREPCRASTVGVKVLSGSVRARK